MVVPHSRNQDHNFFRKVSYALLTLTKRFRYKSNAKTIEV
ncbi:hypothetical protein LEP1GSC008_3489 [Leptospira kirschneri serovar Bulgarica str. Nikolaevo]|uniref:Uncharacterized protein n=1 Tax=Leptospira kirschneri serovar Bulgarica str. Nikolaevo TaxID=1240687 RepID=M6F2N5_9LEPT|nr:hypothetical protein LEP1GSC008_3489 [Leptospira kirschneri serovar Bulgarica str. Nikolaevo]